MIQQVSTAFHPFGLHSPFLSSGGPSVVGADNWNGLGSRRLDFGSRRIRLHWWSLQISTRRVGMVRTIDCCRATNAGRIRGASPASGMAMGMFMGMGTGVILLGVGLSERHQIRVANRAVGEGRRLGPARLSGGRFRNDRGPKGFVERHLFQQPEWRAAERF